MAEQLEEIETLSNEQPEVVFIRDSGWYGKIGCADANPEEMCPDVDGRGPGRKPKPVEVNAIGKYCLGCTVRPDCLASALIEKDVVGIRGGLTAKQRTPLAKSLKAKTLTPQMLEDALAGVKDVEALYESQVAREALPQYPTRQQSKQFAEDFLNLIKSMPDSTYTAGESSVFDQIAHVLGTPHHRVRNAAKRFAERGILELVYAETGRKHIDSIRLLVA